MPKSNRSKALIRMVLSYLIGFAILVSTREFAPQYGLLMMCIVMPILMFYPPYVMYHYGQLQKGAKAYIYNRIMFGVFIAFGVLGMVFMTIILVAVL